MADKKISALTAAATPLAGSEVLPIVQSGSTVKVSVADLTAGRAASALSQSVASFTPDSGAFIHTASSANAASRYWRTANDVAAWADWALQQSTDNTGAAYTTRFYFDGNGNAEVSTGNLVLGTAGKGIDFSANTGAPGMTSELLTWYEEGAWTPVIIGTTSAGTGNYPVQSGRYTRVGNLVHVQMFLLWDSHTGTGDMDISGLPFTSNAPTFNFAGVALGQFENIALSAGNIPMAHIAANSNIISLRQVPTGGGAMATVPLDTAGNIILSASYNV